MKWAALLMLAACGSSAPPATVDASPGTKHDAPPPPPPPVLDGNGCPVGGVFSSMTISDGDMAFTPVHLVLVQGEYAKFVTSSTHDMHITAGNTSTTFVDIGFAQTHCVQFAAGHAQYTVTCTAHGEMGDILVAGSGP